MNSHEPLSDDQAPEYSDHVIEDVAMPASVRTARTVSWVLAVLGIVLVGVGMLTGNPDLAGAIGFSYLFAWLLAGVAFAFVLDGRTVQVVAVVLAALSAFLCLALMAVGPLPGLAGLCLSLGVVVLLCRRESTMWFVRGRY